MRVVLALAALIVVGFVAGGLLFLRALEPVGGGAKAYLRVDRPTDRLTVLQEAEKKGLIKSAPALDLYATLGKRSQTVKTGTYQLFAARTGRENLGLLRTPIVQMVRLPETNWARRSANLLERAEVCRADDYLALVDDPSEQRRPFPLPKASLEGYLYPDTYDLPPLLGARGVVDRQLAAFQKKVWDGLDHPKNLYRTLIVASLVQLEAGTDADRPKIAGVIENRLKQGMPLQIDAGINYGLGVWRPLARSEYKSVDSPYNLYLHKGLPPTPICSPSLASIRAAMAPARHNDVYYVALPDGTSLFAATFEEHKANIKRRKEALAKR